MKNDNINVIVENLFRTLPFIHRKLMKIDLTSVNKGLSHPHIIIMSMLDRSGSLPVSVIGTRMGISKPQMTHLVDKLISLRYVKRLPDANDRRIINVTLTDRGKTTLETCKELIRDNIRQKLSSLEDDDLAELSASLKSLKAIWSKLE